MNPHSLSRSHFRSTLHNDTLYSSTASHNDDARSFSTARRTRTYNMSQHPHQQVSHGHQQYLHQQHAHPHMQSASWNTAASDAPPLLQKVYILDCKSCNNFLTNRGMMAVLLLQPDVPLYSTDALPVNCSATPGPLEYAPSYEAITTFSPSSACPSGMPVPLPRTCECLTQTLCCHGCGNAVGYMVVIPCNRCTSSVSPTNRHTNRHRFVFFNREITASERHYVPHEPGVIATSPRLVSVVAPSSSISSSSSFHPMDPNASPPSAPHFTTVHAQYSNYSSGSIPTLPTPPPDSPSAIDYPSQIPHTIPASPYQHSQNHGFPSFQFVTLKPERGKLLAGDLMYWHNLTRSGEIPAVVEDERARHPREMRPSPWAGR